MIYKLVRPVRNYPKRVLWKPCLPYVYPA